MAACTQEAGRDATIFRLSVASDEPKATFVGRDLLAQGGNAADAAAAMAMMMSVTLPSRVGLGGGGACLVHDPETGVVRALDFLPRAAGGPEGAALPLMIRGLAVLHTEYGNLRWESIVIGAENAARFGVTVSRALARDIALAPLPVLSGVSMTDETGAPLAEGATLEQGDLARLLSRVRTGGPGVFHGGDLARRYAAAATLAGLPLEESAVRDRARPRWVDPVVVEYWRDKLYFLGEPAAPGSQQALIWQAAEDTVDYEDLAADARLHLLVAAEQRAAGAVGVVPGEDSAELIMADYSPEGALSGQGGIEVPRWSANLVALSNDGLAVACSLTLNGLFGSGRKAADTGVTIAGAPSSPDGHLLAGLAMLVNEPKTQFLYGGSADSTVALMRPMMEVLLGESTIGDAMAAPRAEVGPANGVLTVEATASDETIQALRQGGQPVSTVPAIGRGAAIFCLWDRAASSYCSAAADPRGSGLAFTVER